MRTAASTITPRCPRTTWRSRLKRQRPSPAIRHGACPMRPKSPTRQSSPKRGRTARARPARCSGPRSTRKRPAMSGTRCMTANGCWSSPPTPASCRSATRTSPPSISAACIRWTACAIARPLSRASNMSSRSRRFPRRRLRTSTSTRLRAMRRSTSPPAAASMTACCSSCASPRAKHRRKSTSRQRTTTSPKATRWRRSHCSARSAARSSAPWTPCCCAWRPTTPICRSRRRSALTRPAPPLTSRPAPPASM